MPAFYYRAKTPSGTEQKGVIEAEHEKHARQILRERGLSLLSLRAGRFTQLNNKWLTLFQRRVFTDVELALFTRQLAVLISAGLPLEEALLAVAEQNEKSKIKALILSLRAKVLEGHAFQSALREFPHLFSPLFCATVAAGEKSGHLDAVLTRLADYIEQQAELGQKLRTAMIYPSMIVLVAVGIVGFLMKYVVPKMVGVYTQSKQALPMLTSVLIGISDAVGDFGIYVLMAIILAAFLFRYYLRKKPAFRFRMHSVLLRVPLIGYMMKTADTARFSRTLSILSSAGVPILEAMMISAELIHSLPIRDAVLIAVKRVREGAQLHLALKQTQFFTPMSIHMIASGEASGAIENMLERVAHNQETDIKRTIDVGLALFEPAVILIMGGVVLFIVLAILLPIFQLNQF